MEEEVFPIRRAGPWATAYDSYLDRLSSDAAMPVNCARSDWVDQVWEARTINVKFSAPTVYGVIEMGESVSASSFSTDTLRVRFKWQATQEFDIDVNWALSLAGGIGDWFWSYNTIDEAGSGIVDDDVVDLTRGEGAAGGNSGTPSSGSETITLPATVLGTFSFNITGDTEDIVSGSISIT